MAHLGAGAASPPPPRANTEQKTLPAEPGNPAAAQVEGGRGALWKRCLCAPSCHTRGTRSLQHLPTDPFPAPGVGGAGGPQSALQVSLSGRARPGLQPRTCSWFPRGSQSRQEDSLLESASDVFGVRDLPGDPCGQGKPQPDREDAPHPPCRCATTHHAARASPPLSAVPWPRVPHHPRTDLGGEQPPPRGQDSRGLWSTLHGSSVHSTWGPTCRAAQSHSKWLGARFSTEGSNAEAAHNGAHGTGGPCWPGSGGAPPLCSSSRRPASPAQEGTRWLPWGSGGWGAAGLPARLNPRVGEPRPRWAHSLCPGL